MKSLPIIWQRLVSADGRTCDRCSATQQEMQRAVSKLKQALHPLGIEPIVEIREIDEKSFKANPSESNRIWIAGKPMEEWLGAKVGSSRCCSVLWRIRVSNGRDGSSGVRDHSRSPFSQGCFSCELLGATAGSAATRPGLRSVKDGGPLPCYPMRRFPSRIGLSTQSGSVKA